MKHPVTGLLSLWAIPRSRSTAFFRMMVQRGDCLCIHEPFCAIADVGTVDLPNGDGGMVKLTTKQQVVEHILNLSHKKLVFFKETTDHDHSDLLETELFGAKAQTAIMIRTPEEVISSHLRMNPKADQTSMGFGYLLDLVKGMRLSGQNYHMIQSEDLIQNSSTTVQSYCTFANIPFLPEALKWKYEDRQEWSRTKDWHSDAAKSTGINKISNKEPLPLKLQDILENYLKPTQRDYEALLEFNSI